MKTILTLISLVLISSQLFSQENLDKKIDKGIELYKDGKEVKALKIWKQIEDKADKPSSTYGTTLRNILYYYTQKNNEEKSLEYYKKIISSNLNDKDRNYELGEPYKNYRFHSTMIMASYYANKSEYLKALEYVEKADNKIQYETTSLTAFIYQKVDLAFWKYRLLKDLGRKDEAVSKLIERAFEYDYKGMYPNWATVSPSNDENELAEKICSEFGDLKKLKSDIDNGIENLTFDKAKNIIHLSISGVKYEIKLYSELENVNDCEQYLKNSFFYKYLTEKTKK